MEKKNNYINVYKYIISPILQEALQTGQLPVDLDKPDQTQTAGIYLVMFRVLNYKQNILVYNYIYYPLIFKICLIYYLISIRLKEFVDNHYEGNNLQLIDEYFDVIKNGKFSLNDSNTYLDILFTSIIDEPTPLVRCINKINFMCDYDMMIDLLLLGYKKDYTKFIKLILNTMPGYDLDSKWCLDENNWTKSISFINSTTFIVHDLNLFIQKVKNLGLDVNQGPQSSRGQINSIASSLSSFDINFRNSLYNHNAYHITKKTIDSRFYLPKSKFTFNNIHMNLGNARLYTTTTKKQINSNNSLNIIDNKTPNSNKIVNRQNLFDDNYNIITDIIESNKSLSKLELQEKIEKLLRQQEILYSEGSNNKLILKYDIDSYNLIHSKKLELIKLISNINTTTIKNNTHNTKYIPWCKSIICELGVEKITNILISYFLKIVSQESINLKDIPTPGIPTIRAYNEFGKELVGKFRYSKFIHSGVHKELTLNQYINTNMNEFSVTFEDNFYAKVAGFFVWNLCVVNLLYDDLDTNPMDVKKTEFYLRIHPDVRGLLIKDTHKMYHLPMKLPMLCEPKEYIYSTNVMENKLGGYLLNDVLYTDYIFKDKIGYGRTTILNEDNNIVDMINGLSKTPYKINLDTLQFIFKFGVEKEVVMDSNKFELKPFIKNPYNGFNKRDSKKYRQIISKIILEKNILSIAEVYSKVDKIYFPVRLDNRTRIYCETDYFDYQKNDLAKGLLSFSEPGLIYKHDTIPIKYFIAFGANMYGDGLDKKSLNYRVKWVTDNTDKILNFETGDIVNKAENKASFISFCFEYKRFIEFMSNPNSVVFNTYLPIQLDASCNGYQHLVLLTKESILLDKLNLDSSTYDDNPDDFYSYIVEKTEKYIKLQIDSLNVVKDKSDKQIKQLNSYKLLNIVNFDRAVVKKTIMTKSYNASIPTLVQNIVVNLDEKFEGNNKYYTYKKSDVKFKRSDIVNFVMAIRDVLNIESPRIKELSRYLEDIAIICCKLSMPIPWGLPSGAVINESYLYEEKEQINAFSFIKSRYTFKKFIKDKYNLRKQKRATMPNLIHSLDGTSIALLYEDFKKVGSLYTVHDCFAVTANNIPKLISMLKSVYLKIYSDDDYLIRFDKLIRLNISNTRGDEVFNVIDGIETIELPTKGDKDNKVEYKSYPDVNKVLRLSINNKVSNLVNSSYIIK